MKKLFGAPNSEITAREKENTELARAAAREGIVLLKNDSALPLKTRKIALFGMGARKTVKGGTGSGSVQERHSVTIAEGLLNAGYTITTSQYLDDYDQTYHAAYQVWHDTVSARVAGMPIMQAMGELSILGGFQWPAGRRVTSDDIAASDTDTAIYVIARQAGEGADRKFEPGDWFLTEDEKANLKLIAAAYAHSIVIINVGGQIDLTWLDEINGIDALVYFVQGGMAGGDALADLLSGKFSFSGKLADSWAQRYEDIPYAMEYSYLNGDLENEYYREDIFVGYRYFDSFNVKPRFPFGFGLSYTAFEHSTQDIKLLDCLVNVSVRVRNTGNSHAGKEVVQLYLAGPSGRLPREARCLVDFAKTDLLTPGQEQDLDLTFNLADVAVYDEANHSWLLEAGDYNLYIGNSSRNLKPAAVLHLAQEVVTAEGRSCCASSRDLATIAAPPSRFDGRPDGVLVLEVNAKAFQTIKHDYSEPAMIETAEEKRLLDAFSAEELVSLTIGGDLRAQDPAWHAPTGSVGRTSLQLRDHGVGNVVFCDGPAGVNIIDHAVLLDSGLEQAFEVPEKYRFGELAEQAKSWSGKLQGTHVYRYATAWPVHLLLAQTWNTELIEQVGAGTGRELAEFGITLWLAPGMNIHRNPLCGRNFEYFSEDPLVTGRMAAAMTRGVQSHPGIGTTIKHFCCNNQEDNRTGVSSNVSERALREIYLKGFEIAVRESQPLAVMSSYNKLNGIYTANRRDLLTDILRCEWGFQGLVMTDWGSCAPGQGDAARGVPAGNDMIMPGSQADHEVILAALLDGRIQAAELRRCASRVLRLVLNSGIPILR